MTALKIAYLCDISPEHVHPYSGGNARIYRALSERAEVTVLPQDWGMAEPVRRAIYATSDGAQLRLRWRAHLALAPIIAGPINRALRDGGFDVLFGAYSFQSLSHVAPPSGCIKVYSSDATPSVYKNSQIGQEYGSSMLARHLLDPLTLRAERRVLNALDLMLCPSDWLKREAEALYGLPPGLAQVLPWGANIDDPGPAPPPPAPGTDARLDLLSIARDWFAKGGPDSFQTLTELRGRGLDALVGHVGLQFAGLEHFTDDVGAADELALNVELRDRRPVGIVLDAVAQIVGFQHVDALVADAEIIEDLHDLAGKAALREGRRALHEKHDVAGFHLIVDPLVDSCH